MAHPLDPQEPTRAASSDDKVRSLSPLSGENLQESQSKKILINDVFIYNIPPGLRWRDVKALLMNYIPDSTLLHIQIFDMEACAQVSLSSEKSAQVIREQVNGLVWDGYTLTVSAPGGDDEQDDFFIPQMPVPVPIQRIPLRAQPLHGPSPVFTPQQMYPAPGSSLQNTGPMMPHGPPRPGMEMYTGLPMMPGYYQIGRPPLLNASPSSYQSQMMGYYPGPPPQSMVTSGPPMQQYMDQQYTHTPVPQLSQLPLPPPPSQQSMFRPPSFSASSTSSTPMFSLRTPSYSQSSPTISARQLGNLRQYPYHSITNIDSNPTTNNEQPPFPVDKKRLFIGNIPYDTTWMELKDLLRRAGTNIRRVEIPLESIGHSRGFAIAIFDREEDAMKAIDLFDGTSFQGRNITVRYDKFPTTRTGSSGSSTRFDEGIQLVPEEAVDEADEEAEEESEEEQGKQKGKEHHAEEQDKDELEEVQKEQEEGEGGTEGRNEREGEEEGEGEGEEAKEGEAEAGEKEGDNNMHKMIPQPQRDSAEQNEFDDKKYEDEARNLVESLTLGSLTN